LVIAKTKIVILPFVGDELDTYSMNRSGN